MNYENLKTSYHELKNQFELINLKFQNLTEENYNLKKDSLNLGKEIRSKNDLIDSLKSEILSTSKNSSLENLKNDKNSIRGYNDHSHHLLDAKYLNERNYTSTINKSISNNEPNITIRSNTIDHDDVYIFLKIKKIFFIYK
jgi:predicted nuclease with TOPRIM domain